MAKHTIKIFNPKRAVTRRNGPGLANSRRRRRNPQLIGMGNPKPRRRNPHGGVANIKPIAAIKLGTLAAAGIFAVAYASRLVLGDVDDKGIKGAGVRLASGLVLGGLLHVGGMKTAAKMVMVGGAASAVGRLLTEWTAGTAIAPYTEGAISGFDRSVVGLQDVPMRRLGTNDYFQMTPQGNYVGDYFQMQ